MKLSACVIILIQLLNFFVCFNDSQMCAFPPMIKTNKQKQKNSNMTLQRYQVDRFLKRMNLTIRFFLLNQILRFPSLFLNLF